MHGWKPRSRSLRTRSSGHTVKLMVTPPGVVGRSVRAASDYNRACRECEAAGLDLSLLDRYAARIVHTHRRINMLTVEVPEDRAQALKRALKRAGFGVERAFPVAPLLNASIPAMRIDATWKIGFTGAGIRLGIVDTGIDRTHPDFRTRIVAYEDFTGTGMLDKVGHGTHVAGIAAGGGTLYRGAAPDASLVIAKVLTETGGDSADVIAGLSWLSTQGVRVINVSLGGRGNPSDALSRECSALSRDGIAVCVAAGNEGPRAFTISSPGCSASVITVGAVDKRDVLMSYSSRGPVLWGKRSMHKPDVLAVGGDVTSIAGCPYGNGIASARSRKRPKGACDVVVKRSRRYVRMSGTSMATPHVAGLAVLMLQCATASGLNLKPSDLKDLLKRACKRLRYGQDEQGAGRVDALAAIEIVRSVARRAQKKATA